MSLRFAQLDQLWIKLKPPSFSTHITFQDNQRFYILQRGFPHYLGEIIRGASSTDEALLIAEQIAQSLSTCQITGYQIWIVFSGALDGDKVIIEADFKEKMDSRLRAMADFYLLTRILVSPEKFRKWKII